MGEYERIGNIVVLVNVFLFVMKIFEEKNKLKEERFIYLFWIMVLWEILVFGFGFEIKDRE